MGDSRNESRAFYWVATLIAFAGAGILLAGWYANRPLWVDEEMLALNVRDRGFTQLADRLWLNQSAPPGWLALERVALLTIGSSERAVRLLPVMFAIGTLMTGMWIGRRWMGPVGAAVLVLLCSIGRSIVFFSLELKHYSADAMWALFLPALGAWVIETSDNPSRLTRRMALWWLAAAVGQWCSNGALFVTPACAVVLFVVGWRRGGWPAALRVAAACPVWLASFALLYTLALRHSLDNAYLQNYWGFAFPPQAAGIWDIGRWLASQLRPFAVQPVGTGHWVLFWLAVASGIVFATARHGVFGFLLAMVPVSAVLLSVFRLVPAFERLALWVVPSLYVAVAFCADASVWLVARRHARGRFVGLAFALAAGVAATRVSADIFQRGRGEFLARPPSNYGLDDRRSVRLLLKLLRPGDVLLTTHFGLAGTWWYSGLNISGSDPAGSRLQDGTPIFEIGHVQAEGDCASWNDEMADALSGHSRAVVYLGFRLNVLPPGFDNLVLQEFGKRGELVGYQPYAEESRLAVFDLALPPLHPLDLSRAPFWRPIVPATPGENGQANPLVASGCVTVTPARRW